MEHKMKADDAHAHSGILTHNNKRRDFVYCGLLNYIWLPQYLVMV